MVPLFYTIITKTENEEEHQTDEIVNIYFIKKCINVCTLVNEYIQ